MVNPLCVLGVAVISLLPRRTYAAHNAHSQDLSAFSSTGFNIKCRTKVLFFVSFQRKKKSERWSEREIYNRQREPTECRKRTERKRNRNKNETKIQWVLGWYPVCTCAVIFIMVYSLECAVQLLQNILLILFAPVIY